MPSPTDDDLISRVRDGDGEAFAELTRRYSGKVFAISMSMLRNEQDALDVVQDTFLNVHRRLDSFRGDAAFSSWIRRITTNNALMKLRTRRRKPETSLELKSPGFDGEGRHERVVVDVAPLADEIQESQELGRAIRQAVDDLPEKYRIVLILADYRQMTMKEIAEELELTVPNVKTRLHRARLAIREALQDYVAGER